MKFGKILSTLLLVFACATVSADLCRVVVGALAGERLFFNPVSLEFHQEANLIGALIEFKDGSEIIVVTGYVLGPDGHKSLIDQAARDAKKEIAALRWAGEIKIRRGRGGRGFIFTEANETSGHYADLLKLTPRPYRLENDVRYLQSWMRENNPTLIADDFPIQTFAEAGGVHLNPRMIPRLRHDLNNDFQALKFYGGDFWMRMQRRNGFRDVPAQIERATPRYERINNYFWLATEMGVVTQTDFGK